MGDYRKLKVWQKARELRRVAYRLTVDFPAHEQYGLKGQIRRAAGSIMANLAEGCGRNGDRELLRFVLIALGSATELESHLTAARDQGLAISPDGSQAIRDTAEVRRMLAGLARRLKQ